MEALPGLIIIGAVIFFIIYNKNETEKKRREAYAEFQEALQGKSKKNALEKGRYYVSLFPVKSQLLEETKIQNDLHGMDDAIRDIRDE
jgi:hypothetical protein